MWYNCTNYFVISINWLTKRIGIILATFDLIKASIFNIRKDNWAVYPEILCKDVLIGKI
jgi:hypothetical protein